MPLWTIWRSLSTASSASRLPPDTVLPQGPTGGVGPAMGLEGQAPLQSHFGRRVATLKGMGSHAPPLCPSVWQERL